MNTGALVPVLAGSGQDYNIKLLPLLCIKKESHRSQKYCFAFELGHLTLPKKYVCEVYCIILNTCQCFTNTYFLFPQSAIQSKLKLKNVLLMVLVTAMCFSATLMSRNNEKERMRCTSTGIICLKCHQDHSISLICQSGRQHSNVNSDELGL